MKQAIFWSLIVYIIIGCNKNDKDFKLKEIKLNSYERVNLTKQSLSFRIVEQSDSRHVLARTDPFSSESPLPVSLRVVPNISSKLYDKSYTIQLFGDSTGLIGSCRVEMNNYKIIFPIEMDVENEQLNISISGSWH